jgi:hypothetical protein
MSQVFTCGCGRRTTEPFILRGEKFCTICADDIAPEIVTSRERHNLRTFGPKRHHSSGFEVSVHEYARHRKPDLGRPI